MLFESGPPRKIAKLSKIWWKNCKFWKRISMDQIQCGGEGHGGNNPIVFYKEMKLQFELHVSIEPAAASLQRFNWSGPPPGTRNFSRNTSYMYEVFLWFMVFCLLANKAKTKISPPHGFSFFFFFFFSKELVLLCLSCGRWRISQTLGPPCPRNLTIT